MGIKKFRINKYEPAEDERRLAEYAQKGEFIAFQRAGFAYFKNGEPKKTRYCIEVSYFGASRKKRNFYAENGWKRICRGGDVDIFAAEENAVPLHTDRAEYAHLIKKFHRARIAENVILCGLLLICCAAPILFMRAMTGELVMMFARWSLYGFSVGIFGTVLAVTLVYMAFFFHGLLDSFAAGKIIAGNIENGKTAEKAMRNNRLFAAITAAAAIIAAAVNIFYGYCALVSSDGEAEPGNVPPDAFFAEDIFPEERYITVKSDEDMKYLRPEKRTENNKAAEIKAWQFNSVVTEKYYVYFQQGILLDEGGEYGDITSPSAEYICFRSDIFARLAAMERVRNEEIIFHRGKDSVLIEHNASGTSFDRIITLTCKNGVDEHIISLQRGKKVYFIKVFSDGISTEELLENILTADK